MAQSGTARIILRDAKKTAFKEDKKISASLECWFTMGLEDQVSPFPKGYLGSKKAADEQQFLNLRAVAPF